MTYQEDGPARVKTWACICQWEGPAAVALRWEVQVTHDPSVFAADRAARPFEDLLCGDTTAHRAVCVDSGSAYVWLKAHGCPKAQALRLVRESVRELVATM